MAKLYNVREFYVKNPIFNKFPIVEFLRINNECLVTYTLSFHIN